MPLMLETERLLMREWRAEDFAAFYAMNRDPEVRRYYAGLQSLAQAHDFMVRALERDARDGFFFQPVFEKETGAFVGDLGLAKIDFEAPFKGGTEIGWMLQQAYWGRGYAVEMATALLNYAVTELMLDEVLAFTVPSNHRSRRVMEKLGMQRDPEGDFENPMIPDGHPYRAHVLYRISLAGA